MNLNKAIDKSKKNIVIIFGLLLSLGIVVAFCVVFFFNKNVVIPKWVSLQEKELSYNGKLTVTLSKGRVTIKGLGVLWTSPKEYVFQDILISDLDNDDRSELISLVWKRGKYGNAMPFWVKENDNSVAQHLFIYELRTDGEPKQKWFASDVGTAIRRMKLMDQNPAILLTETIEDENDLWRWESFGLKNMDNEVRLVAFGDNIIHKEIYEYARMKKGGKFDFLYEPFKKEIESADIAVIQAETILAHDENAVSGYPRFGSPLAVGKAIKNAGFDVAVCGNNHALDKGIYGINVTTDFYKNNDILCVGIQNTSDAEYRPYELISRHGIRFALFSYTYGTNDISVSDKYPNAVHYLPANADEEESLISDIQKAKEEADICLIFVHWGEEYSTDITEEQRRYSDIFALAGADVVIGTHPHVVQPMETITRPDGKNMTVFYSLGNFRAYQGRSEQTKSGAEAILTIEHCFDGVKVSSAELSELNAYVTLE